jgi:general secretion pathway protein A
MYCNFFKLAEEPFNLRSDPKFLFLSPGYRQKLAGFTYGILNHKKFLVLTGEIGTGKTTMISAVSRYLPTDRARIGVLSGQTLSPSEISEMMLLSFGITEIPASAAGRIRKLQEFCDSGEQDGKISAVIFDEAQRLSVEALEEIRLIGNLKSLGIVLAGQSDLEDSFRKEELRALKQRICLWLTLEPLQEGEVEHYIRYRWKKAGGIQSAPFSEEAIGAIAQQSRGVPRLINSLCDNALMSAFEQERVVVDLADVAEAVRRLRLEESVGGGDRKPSPAEVAPSGLQLIESSGVKSKPPNKEVAFATPPHAGENGKQPGAGESRNPITSARRFFGVKVRINI